LGPLTIQRLYCHQRFAGLDSTGASIFTVTTVNSTLVARRDNADASLFDRAWPATIATVNIASTDKPTMLFIVLGVINFMVNSSAPAIIRQGVN